MADPFYTSMNSLGMKRFLGRTGVTVSNICLGTMTFGDQVGIEIILVLNFFQTMG